MFTKQAYSAYKCVLDSLRMIFILAALLNAFLEQWHYPKHQVRLVETTLKKGKGSIIGKLWNIALIEGNFQIEMRIALNSDLEETIENYY